MRIYLRERELKELKYKLNLERKPEICTKAIKNEGNIGNKRSKEELLARKEKEM